VTAVTEVENPDSKSLVSTLEIIRNKLPAMCRTGNRYVCTGHRL